MREKIDSLSNRKIKDTAALATRRGRQKQGRFVAEGLRLGEMAAAAADAGWKTCYALYTADLASGERGAKLLDTLEAQGCPLYETADAAFRKACATESPQGILIVLEMKQNGLESLQNQGESAPFYVVLDGVQDPGNAGTIIRTADAAGAAGVLFTKGSVDVYEEKTVRATMGSLFHLPVVSGVTVDELASWAQEKGLQLLAAALDWVSKGHVEEYMSSHRNDTDITELKAYFTSVIDWITSVFDMTPEKEMCGLLCHQHGTALAHTEHFIRLCKDPHRSADLFRIDEVQCFRHRGQIRRVKLLAHILHAVRCFDLTGEVLPSAGMLPRRRVGDGKLKSVVALIAEPPAEARHRRFRHAALFRELRD